MIRALYWLQLQFTNGPVRLTHLFTATACDADVNKKWLTICYNSRQGKAFYFVKANIATTAASKVSTDRSRQHPLSFEPPSGSGKTNSSTGLYINVSLLESNHLLFVVTLISLVEGIYLWIIWMINSRSNLTHWFGVTFAVLSISRKSVWCFLQLKKRWLHIPVRLQLATTHSMSHVREAECLVGHYSTLVNNRQRQLEWCSWV